jgi:hypothetical protein
MHTGFRRKSQKEDAVGGVRSDMDWIHLGQDRDQWRAVVDTVMKLRGL